MRTPMDAELQGLDIEVLAELEGLHLLGRLPGSGGEPVAFFTGLDVPANEAPVAPLGVAVEK